MVIIVPYTFYYPIGHNLQCVHICIFENALVFVSFICPGGSFAFFYDVLLGFRGTLTVSTRGVVLEFVFRLNFTGSINFLVFMIALHSFPLSCSKYSGLFVDSWVFAVFPLVFCFGLVFSFLLGLLSDHFRYLFVYGIFISFFENFVVKSFTLNSSRSPLFFYSSCCFHVASFSW